MQDYVIRRNKIRMFFWWLVITGIAVVFSLLTLVYLVDDNLAPLDKWLGILLFAFVVITSTWASMAIAGQLVFGSSEFLRLTQEGFYYTGHDGSWAREESLYCFLAGGGQDFLYRNCT